jgi:putative sigma-54 modulation protein
MQIHISTQHLKLTGAIHAHVAQKVSHLEHLTDQIIGAHIVLVHDETKSPAKAYGVKAHLAVPGPDIHIEEHHRDLYAAVDIAVEKLSGQLRKRKTKIVDQRHRKAQRTREIAKKLGKGI